MFGHTKGKQTEALLCFDYLPFHHLPIGISSFSTTQTKRTDFQVNNAVD